MEQLIIVFSSNQQALMAESVLEEAGIEYDIIPLPPQFKAGCSLAITFFKQDKERVKSLLSKAKVQYQGIYQYA